MPVKSMSIEALFDEVAKLTNTSRLDGTPLILFQGEHPEHGQVSIIIPPLGNGFLMLPPDPI